MNVLRWNKWPAPFKAGAFTLILSAIVLASTLVWSWDTYAPIHSPGPLPYETLVRTVIDKICAKDRVVDIKYKKLGKPSFIDKTFLVSAKLANKQKKKFVVKILSQERWLAHRQYITQLYQLSASLGLGPQVHFEAPEKGIIILEYIEGRHLGFSDLQNISNIKKLAHLLESYHKGSSTVPPCTVSNSLLSRVENRLFDLMPLNPPLFEKIHTYIQSYIPSTHKITMTHSDLKLSNILVTPQGRIYIIDWGEAHHDNPLLDLASLSHHGGLSDNMEKKFLHFYFGRHLTAQEKADLQWYKNLSLLHTSALALRQASPKNLQLIKQKRFDSQRLKQLLHKFYQEGALSKEELIEMGSCGIIHFMQNSMARESRNP